MNKIININLAGRFIPIDENAFADLSNYINWLKQFFSNEKGGDEIVRDMEDRIGELFQNKLKDGSPCITHDDVQSMIKIMGSPEQIAQESDEGFNQDENTTAHQTQYTSSRQGYINNEKKLKRSKNDKVIGGICGGIAAHFNLDPAIVRIAFALIALAWGTGVLVYLILWAILPDANTNTIKALGRKLYRNPDKKVIGGVCSGLAAYFKMDTLLVRLLFLLPVVFGTLFSFFDFWDSDFSSLFLGGFPATITIMYFVMMASVPNAKTVVQKLEMNGESIDVQTLSDTFNHDNKKSNNSNTEVQDNRSPLAKVIILLMKIAVFFFLGIVLILLVSTAIAFWAAMFGVAVSGATSYPFMSLVTDSENLSWVLWISLFMLFMIPFFITINFIIRIITGLKRQANKWRSYFLAVAFFAALAGAGIVIGNIASDFSNKAVNQQEFSIQQPTNDTLIIAQEGRHGDGDDMDSNTFRFGWRMRSSSVANIPAVSLSIAKSADSSFHIITENEAYGNSTERAKKLAQNFSYTIRQEGNRLILPKNILLEAGSPYRGQNLHVIIQVPQHAVFKTENLNDDIYEHKNIIVGNSSIRVDSYEIEFWKNNRYYKIDDKPGNAR